MTNEPKAVQDVEEKTIDPTPDTDNPDDYVELAPTSGEKETPPVNSADEEKPEEPTEEASAPSEPEAPKAEEAPEKSDVSILAQDLQHLSEEYKRAENETEIEYARRLEIIRLRKKVQSNKASELLGEETKPEPKQVQEEDAYVDPEELADFEKKAKALGFAKQSEIQAQNYNSQAKDVFDSWLGDHPEYDQVHDPDGILWNRLKEEFNSGLYNTKPQNPKHLKTILDKIHVDIFGIQPTSNLSKVKAQQEKVKVASHSAASPGGSSSAPEDKSKSAKKALLERGLVGFSEEELNELAEED